MTMYTDSPAHPSDAARDVIRAVAPMISAAIDPMNTMVGLAALVGDARAGGVVGRGGLVHRLPGMPLHPRLTENSRVVLTALANLTDRRTQAAFLCPDPHGRDDYARVTAIACPPSTANHFTALILISPTGDLLGLTRRELEVLGFVIDGRTNQHIAHALFITERAWPHIWSTFARNSARPPVRSARFGPWIWPCTFRTNSPKRHPDGSGPAARRRCHRRIGPERRDRPRIRPPRSERWPDVAAVRV